jgi:hypothetical protein
MKDEDQDTSCDEGPARAAARRLPRRHWAALRPARRGRPAAGHVRSESGETRRRRTAVYVRVGIDAAALHRISTLT